MTTRPALPLPGFELLKHIPWLSAAVLALVTAPAILGQASAYTASQPMRLQGFVTYSHLNPDYGTPSTDTGVSLGTDMHLNVRGLFKPGLEVRATNATGPEVNQTTFAGGPRVIMTTRFIQPYADFLMGGGKITFNQPSDPLYTKDRSTVYTIGGGADFLLTRTFALKLDAQHERWRLSHKLPPFAPMLMSVGVRYQFQLGGRNSPR